MTLDIVDDLGHAIDDRSMQLALNHLRYTVPKHYFDEALSGGKPNDDDIVMNWCETARHKTKVAVQGDLVR